MQALSSKNQSFNELFGLLVLWVSEIQFSLQIPCFLLFKGKYKKWFSIIDAQSDASPYIILDILVSHI